MWKEGPYTTRTIDNALCSLLNILSNDLGFCHRHDPVPQQPAFCDKSWRSANPDEIMNVRTGTEWILWEGRHERLGNSRRPRRASRQSRSPASSVQDSGAFQFSHVSKPLESPSAKPCSVCEHSHHQSWEHQGVEVALRSFQCREGRAILFWPHSWRSLPTHLSRTCCHSRQDASWFNSKGLFLAFYSALHMNIEHSMCVWENVTNSWVSKVSSECFSLLPSTDHGPQPRADGLWHPWGSSSGAFVCGSPWCAHPMEGHPRWSWYERLSLALCTAQPVPHLLGLLGAEICMNTRICGLWRPLS